MEPIYAREFYQSAEFKALCLKFGIAWAKATKSMTIYIPEEGLVEVSQSYILEQDYKKEEDARTNSHIETTNQHNKECRTYASPRTDEQVSESCTVVKDQ